MIVHSPIRIGRIIGLLCLLGVLAAPRTITAAATSTIDQEQDQYHGALSVRKDTSQTFTVGRSGTLTEVDIVLCTEGKGNQILLEVGPLAAPLPPHIAVGLTFSTNTYKCTWHPFRITNPLSVAAGEQMIIIVKRVTGFAPLWGYYGIRGADPYSGGEGTWQGHTVNDFTFRAWVAS